jgi:hypothetical protein
MTDGCAPACALACTEGSERQCLGCKGPLYRCSPRHFSNSTRLGKVAMADGHCAKLEGSEGDCAQGNGGMWQYRRAFPGMFGARFRTSSASRTDRLHHFRLWCLRRCDECERCLAISTRDAGFMCAWFARCPAPLETRIPGFKTRTLDKQSVLTRSGTFPDSYPTRVPSHILAQVNLSGVCSNMAVGGERRCRLKMLLKRLQSFKATLR